MIRTIYTQHLVKHLYTKKNNLRLLSIRMYFIIIITMTKQEHLRTATNIMNKNLAWNSRDYIQMTSHICIYYYAE